MAFVSGPRQVGKTTLAKSFLKTTHNYFSWDEDEFRRAWSKSPSKAIEMRGNGPIVLDEIHKDRRWKQRLKGIFDTKGDEIPIIVTGSARLDIYKKGGDSLMGRYLPWRLHPFSVAEQANIHVSPNEFKEPRLVQYPWNDLLKLGGFPEPLFQASEAKAKRWSRLRLDRLVQEDVRDLKAIRDLQALRVLVDLLPERVGSLLSINNLREDAGIAYASAYEWILVLEALYHCFLIRPFAGKLKRTLKAEPKLFLFDILQIKDPAARLENLAALHLLKACHYWTDSAEGDFELRFLRDKEKAEVDFCITREGKPWLLIEAKSSETTPSPALIKFSRALRTTHNYQLVTEANYHREYPEHDITVMSYERFFSGMV